MGKITNIKKIIQEKEKAAGVNKPIGLQLLEINERVLTRQERLIGIIENQQLRIQRLSDVIGSVEEHFAEQGIYLDEFDISELDEE